MPVDPGTLTAAIMAAAPTMVGPSWAKTAGAIGTGVVAWAITPGNVVMAGITTGVIGGGVVVGKLVIPPDPAGLVAGALAASGVVGPTSPKIGAAVGVGIGTAYSASGAYVGASLGAIGADASKVILTNPLTLAASLSAAFIAAGIAGPSGARLIAGLTPGICALFLLGVGTGFATGIAGPLPGIGGSASTPI